MKVHFWPSIVKEEVPHIDLFLLSPQCYQMLWSVGVRVYSDLNQDKDYYSKVVLDFFIRTAQYSVFLTNLSFLSVPLQ